MQKPGQNLDTFILALWITSDDLHEAFRGKAHRHPGKVTFEKECANRSHGGGPDHAKYGCEFLGNRVVVQINSRELQQRFNCFGSPQLSERTPGMHRRPDFRPIGHSLMQGQITGHPDELRNMFAPEFILCAIIWPFDPLKDVHVADRQQPSNRIGVVPA